MPDPIADVIVHNQDALEELAWAIEASQGQFTLILARCNYVKLREILLQQLQEMCAVPIRVIELQHTSKTLYSRIREEQEQGNIEALSIIGLRAVDDLDEMLPAVNSVREEFRKHFSFPIVLWVSDEVHRKLVKLAPDFESWATTTHFSLPSTLLQEGLQVASDRLFSSLLRLESRRSFRRPLGAVDLGFLNLPEIETALRDLQQTHSEVYPDLQATLDFVRGFTAPSNVQALAHFYRSLEHWRGQIAAEPAADEGAVFAQTAPHEALSGSDADSNLKDEASNENLPPSNGNPQPLEFKLEPSSGNDRASNAKVAPSSLNDRPPNSNHALLNTNNAAQTSELETPNSEVAALNSKIAVPNTNDAAQTSELGIPNSNKAVPSPKADAPPPLSPSPSPQLKAGLLLYFIGRTLYNIGIENWRQSPDWNAAKLPMQECLAIFEQANRPDLVARSITQLARILEKLEAWDELEAVVQRSLPLQERYNNLNRQAQDLRYLAKVALVRQQGETALGYAQRALAANQQLGSEQRYRGLYFLSLAEAQRQLGQLDAAIATLSTARDLGDQGIPRVYIQILEELRECYLEQKDYGAAFRLKQERLSIEQQYRLRAFVGAARLRAQQQDQEAELYQIRNLVEPQKLVDPQAQVPTGIASWQRQRDVKQLLERIGRNDCKLIVIHGYSGVGKSSLIGAGLVPILEQKPIGVQDNLPVVVRKYTDWLPELGQQLSKAIVAYQTRQRGRSSPSSESTTSAPAHLYSANDILDTLQRTNQKLRIVLIFDQFEEFFFVHTTPAQRRPFYDFLGQCLQLPLLKVVLPLREDYLYYLLEFNRVPTIAATGIDILSRNVLYPLGNFAPEDARAIIQELTAQASFYLEPALIDALVQDLTDETGEVRPIEMQIVGAQLQTDDIHDLETYRQLRDSDKPAKEILVERYLSEVIADCGEENDRAAQRALYLLTNEDDTRPLKTRAELVEDMGSEADKLDFVLDILVRSGLVMLLPEVPDDRYQLVHDYLVPYIRQGRDLKAELAQERAMREEAEAKLTTELAQRLKAEEQASRALKQRLQLSRIAGLTLTAATIGIGALWFNADNLRKNAEAQQVNAEINAMNATSESLLSDQTFSALLEAMRSVKRATHDPRVTPGTRMQSIATLQQAVYLVQERNRLEGHTAVVWSVAFSPDGQTLATASEDKTIKLWNREGQELKNLKGHTDEVLSVAFSPDGQTLATASVDKTVKLWSRDGRELKTLKGHTEWVVSVTFSPDGQTLATASGDKTFKLWSREGRELKTLKGHMGAVRSVAFSPDGQTLATASWDKTVKLWSRDGRELKMLKGHTNGVGGVAFSPDGQTLATASVDKTVKLWSRERQESKTLKGHTDGVGGVAFSPDGQTLATASWDKTVKLWSRDGRELKTFKGHTEEVYDIAFSPDGQTLATASEDKTIKLWNREGRELKTFRGHTDPVVSVAFSPDGQTLATASGDKTVKLWSRDGRELKMLKGHTNGVGGVAFSPDGQTLATASWDKTVKLWNREGRELKTFRGHTDPVVSVAFSPDGQTLVTTSRDKTVKLWNREGRELKTLRGHTDDVRSVAFSPDGQTLVTTSRDKTVKLWNREGRELKTLRVHTDDVRSVAFSPDGQTLATTSRDKTIKLWNLDAENLMGLGCDWLRDYLTNNPEGKNDRYLCEDVWQKAPSKSPH